MIGQETDLRNTTEKAALGGRDHISILSAWFKKYLQSTSNTIIPYE